MRYHVIKYGGTYLSDVGEYWTRWTTFVENAMTFDTLGDAVEFAALVGGEAVPA